MTCTLVTGAAGFIGSHLVEALVVHGRRVRALVHYNSRNFWGWLEESDVLSRIEVIAGDVRDYDSVHSAMRGCDEVFHLAALIGIPYSYDSPLAYIRTNVEGTYNVLQAARALEVPNVLVTSTSETYGTAQFVPITEAHPLVGQSPYSATKIAADQLAVSYHRSFQLPVKIVRPFNTYGPRQSARAVIPTVISQILAGKRRLTLGNLSPTRDLTFVRDTAEGFVAIAETPALSGQVVHISNQAEISIGELAKLIAELCGVEVQIDAEAQRLRPAASEVERLLGDNSRILAQTRWRPKVSLREGLSRTIAWMRDHLDLYKTDVYNK